MTVSRGRLLAAFAAIYVIWGSTFLAVAVAVQTIPPFLMMGFRCVLGGVIMLALAWAGGAGRAPLGTWLRAALGGTLLFLCCHGLMAYAETKVSSGLTAVLMATIPFWFVLLDAVLPGATRPRPATLLGLLPGFGGVLLIAWREAASGGPASPAMLGVILFASFAWALGSVLSRGRSASVSAMQFSGMQLVAGGAVLLVASGLGGEIARFSPGAVSAASWAGMLYLALAGTVVTFGAYVWLLDHVPAPLVATCTFVNPIIAVLLGWAVLGEHVGLDMLAGSVLVIGSVILVWRLSARPSPRAACSIPRPAHASRTSTSPSPSCDGSAARAAAGGSDGP